MNEGSIITTQWIMFVLQTGIQLPTAVYYAFLTRSERKTEAGVRLSLQDKHIFFVKSNRPYH